MTLQQQLDLVLLNDGLTQITFQAQTGTLPFTVQFYNALNQNVGASRILSVSSTNASSLLYLYRTAMADTSATFPVGAVGLTFSATGNILVGYAGRRDGSVNPSGSPTQIIATGTNIRVGPNVSAQRGQKISDESVPVVLSTTQRISYTGLTVALVPTISASPDYSANDCAGGIQSLTSVNLESGRPVKLVSVTAKDKNGQSPALTLLFFKSQPSGTFTDNAAVSFGADDLTALVGVVRIVSGDYYTPVSGKTVAALGGINQILDVDATTLYCVIVVDATWNAASTSDLTLEIGLEQI